MAERSKKRKQSRARTKRREQLSAHVRRVKQGPLRGAKILVEPKGQAKMIQRKLTYFAENRRYILSIELTDTGQGYYLSVASSPGDS